MTLLYFARIRELIGIAEERVSPPATVQDVASLLTWLKSRGPNYTSALANLESVRVAVNQAYARPLDRVSDADEVALFPPVTGGLG